jgi:RNA polymerase sigma-70 factor (family 1)
MTNILIAYERILIDKLKSNDKSAFTTIFSTYYKDLVRFACTYTRNQDAAEEIVQEVFLKLWENRNSLLITSSLKSFFLKSVQNRCIDWLRHLSIRDKYALLIFENPYLAENDTENYVLHSELESSFKQALEKIPEEYTEVFKMSRIEALNYQEIAMKLGVSERTIEVRISKALRLLRENLKEFLFWGLTIYLLF